MRPVRRTEPAEAKPCDAPRALPAGAAARTVERWREGHTTRLTDCVAEEVPVALWYNDAPFAVMMATPGDLEDFALGFSLSEGVVADADELLGVEVRPQLEGIELRMRIPAARATALLARERGLEGRSGCGICGTRHIEDVVRPLAKVAAGAPLAAAALRSALRGMSQAQPLNAATGATHAAAWADASGRIVALREDVGRHNALDKLIGAVARAGLDPGTGFVVVTSRASYEMVMKAASLGVGLLAAVSAPTALAVDLAQACGMTLVGFAREGDCAVYTHPHRYQGSPP